MQGGTRTHPIRALVGSWLLLDFFGDARRTGGVSSTLTTTIFSQSFVSLGAAALLYPEVPPVPFAAATLSVSTLFVAIGAKAMEFASIASFSIGLSDRSVKESSVDSSVDSSLAADEDTCDSKTLSDGGVDKEFVPPN